MLAPALALALIAAKAPPPRHYDAQHYRIEVTLKENGAFENVAKVTLVPTRRLRTVALDSFGLDVQKVEGEGGADVPFTLKEDPASRSGVLTLKPKKALPAKKAVTFAIHYKGKANEGAHQGLFRTVDPQNDKLLPYFFTQLEPDSARRFFPCNDRPDDKATTELYAIVDARYQVLSNGKKVLDETYQDKGAQLRRVHWKQEKPHAPYLVALAVGQFKKVEVTASTSAALWVQPGDEDRAFVAVQSTEHALPFMEAFLGVKYPWAKYHQVSVPRFTWGGMENTSLTFMRPSGLVLADKNHIDGRTRITSLVSHELAHQWFGDLVTCPDWTEVWLNEGFATYMSWKSDDAWYDNDLVEVGRVRRILDGYFRQEDGPRSRPLVAKDGKETFDATAYAKGAQILWMLEKWVGEDAFKKGLEAYLETYAHQNPTSKDFFEVFARATGQKRELRGFERSWLYKRGYPVITPSAQWNGDSLTVTIRQRPNHPDERGAFVFKLPVVFHREGTASYHKKEVILVDKPVVRVEVQLPAAPQWVNWNEDLGALVRVDDPAVSEEDWARAVRGDPDPTWRVTALYHLLGTVVDKDAEKLVPPSATAMNAIRHALERDPSAYVREAVLGWLSDSQWKRLPKELGPTLFTLARSPEHLSEDALGRIRVRKAALAALGKVEHEEGRAYLLGEVMKPTVDLNYLPGFARGVANLGDSIALTTLRAAIRTARGRGYNYFRVIAGQLGAVPNPNAVPMVEELLADNPGNNALLTDLIRELDDNRTVKTTPELAAFVKTFVLTSTAFGDDLKARMLHLLDEVKTGDARAALQEIAEKAPSQDLKESARRVLAKNFPGARAVPAKGKAPARGKKK